jgi:phage repressor protein C with HTH and peptisase S24 domain
MAVRMMDQSIIGQVDISTIPPTGFRVENAFMAVTTDAGPEGLFRERVAERLKALGKSPRAVSIEIGANVGYVRDLLDPEKTGIPRADRLNRLAAALETTADYLLAQSDASAQIISEVRFGEFRQEWRGSPSDRLPVHGTGYCDDLEIEVDGQVVRIEQSLFEPTHVIQMIQRPPALRGYNDAYAIYFHGSSMEHRFYQGEIGIVVPAPPPGPGDFVVVQLNDGATEDVIHVLVKRLIRTTSSYVELEQFNPAVRFRVDRRRVTRMHRILGSTDIFRH